jgi:hypothetical protein
MSQPAERRDDVTQVVDMVEYLRDFIARIDEAVTPWLAKRQELALRLTAIEAANDPVVVQAAADYQGRVEANRPYEYAEDAEELLSEAHRHYCP